MNQLDLSAQNNKLNYLPGEWIEGKALWQLDRAVDWLEVRLLWFTQGKGDSDISVEDTLRIEAPGLTDSRAFRFRLPAAPYSFSGRLISLIWAVEIVAEGVKEAARLEFEMAPGGHEVELGTVASPLSNQQSFQQRKAAYQARRSGKSDDSNSPWSS